MKPVKILGFLSLASAFGVWSCSSDQYAQKGEYDDMYFSSADKSAVQYTASAADNGATYTPPAADAENETQPEYSQKNVNPEYVQQYAQQSRDNAKTETNGNDSYSADDVAYYDEEYERKPIDLARNYYDDDRYNRNAYAGNGFGYGYPYGGGFNSFYDPFWGPSAYNGFYQDPFFFRPGLSIGIGMGAGWGWGRPYYGGGWGRPWGWNSWGYGDPFYNGFYGNPWYGGGFYGNPWYGGGYYNRPIVIVNPDNGNNGRPRVQYGPRNSRSSSTVNDNFSNSPRSNANRGRVDQNATNGRSGRVSQNNSSNDSPRVIRPRSSTTTDSYQPRTNRPSYSSGSERTSGNAAETPRVVRPRSNTSSPRSYDNSRSNNGNNSYFENRSNRTTTPSYDSNPRQRSYDVSPRSNNNGWNNSGSNNNRSFDSGSRGSFSTPSSVSPRSGGSSSGSSSGGGSPRSPRSPR